MATFLLTWNPKCLLWSDLPEIVARVRRGEQVDDNWSTGCRRSGMRRGDRFFMLRQGPKPRGIFGNGTIRSKVYQGEHWRNKDGEGNYADIRFEMLADPDKECERIIAAPELIERFGDRYHFGTVLSSGQALPDDVAEELEAWWQERYGAALGDRDTSAGRLATIDRHPEEVPENQSFLEGAVCTIRINAYERNRDARQACIAHWGTTCCVCRFDFGRAYGKLGRGYIQVHHLTSLSDIGEEYEIDPVNDLRPVCPNCHAMIHSQDPPLTIKKLRQLVKKQRDHRRQQRTRSS